MPDTSQRITAQQALRDIGQNNGWIVHNGSFSERRLVFERGALKLTADFHPGGALKQATRYVGKDVVKELHKGQQRIREQFEKWLREKPALPIDPDTSVADPEVESPEVKFCGLPSAQMGCVLCGAVVFDMRAHTAWHKGMGR